MSSATAEQSELSPVLIVLLKGVLYRDSQERLWRQLLTLRSAVADYVDVLGLVVEIDEAEGYAFLRSRPPGERDSEEELPRLIARRSLSFHVSLLLALLRKKLAEFDAVSAETRLILSREQIVEMLRVFLPNTTNESRLIDNVEAHLNKVVDLGFLRRLHGDSQQYEVRRIIKAFVDGQWLAEFDARLRTYAEQLEAPR